MAKAGRKTKYTPETVKKIVEALSVGATRQHACWYAGISEDTFANWLRDKSEFSEAIKEAEGRAVVKWQAVIEKASTESWQAAAWKLERRYPRDYGRQIHEFTGQNGEPFKVYLNVDVEKV